MTDGQEGQTVNEIWIATDDEFFELWTVEHAAKEMKLTPKYVGQLCADLKLIAIKISGRWFPLREACETYGFEPYETVPL